MPWKPIHAGDWPGDIGPFSMEWRKKRRTSSPTRYPKLKSLAKEDAQGKVQPICRLYACGFASVARDTAQSITSGLARCTVIPLNPSAIDEHDGHPAVYSGPNIKW